PLLAPALDCGAMRIDPVLIGAVTDRARDPFRLIAFEGGVGKSFQLVRRNVDAMANDAVLLHIALAVMEKLDDLVARAAGIEDVGIGEPVLVLFFPDNRFVAAADNGWEPARIFGFGERMAAGTGLFAVIERSGTVRSFGLLFLTRADERTN